MACFLLHSKLYGECGDSRGISGLFWLTECDDDIQSHLASLHLSRELLTEQGLILARLRTFDLNDSAIKGMRICARHRHNLGKFWRPSTACLYPKHEGRPGWKSSKSRYAVSLDMSKKIQRILESLYQSVQVRNRLDRTQICPVTVLHTKPDKLQPKKCSHRTGRISSSFSMC